jgi:hypothetical protein
MILNVYRAPSTNDVVDYITTLVPPNKCIIRGDFNAHHDFFEPEVITFGCGGELVNWSTNNQMDYIGEPGIPTHAAGHVLDLTFLNILYVQTFVSTDIHSGSDYETLVTTILRQGRPCLAQYQYRITEADMPKFVGLVKVGALALANPWNITLREQINVFATALAGVFQVIIKAAGRPDRGGGMPAPWWTQECKDTHRAYLQTYLGLNELTPEKRRFLTVVRKSKQEYWRHIIDSASDDASLYKVIGWHRLASDLKAPPLKVGDSTVKDTLKKAEVLREKILGRFSAEDDLEEDPLDSFDQWHGVTYLP